MLVELLNLVTLVFNLTSATVSKFVIVLLSYIADFVASNKTVLRTAVGGAIPGTKLEVYNAVPFTTLTPAIYPVKMLLPVFEAPTLAADAELGVDSIDGTPDLVLENARRFDDDDGRLVCHQLLAEYSFHLG